MHPAKANLHLIERLIELASSPGDLILDPFAGTFSTWWPQSLWAGRP